MSFKPSASPLRLVPFLLLVSACTFARAQVIRLRDPLSSDVFALRPGFLPGTSVQTNAASSNTPSRPASPGPFKNDKLPASIKSPHPPKPGNVIVRFDQDHEISRLEYVMPDGRLATVYTRHHAPDSTRNAPPSNGHQRQTVSTDGQRLMERLEKAQQAQAEVAGQAVQPAAQMPSTPQQTNGNLQPQVKQPPVASIELDTSEFEQAGELDDQPDPGTPPDETGEILATIAGDIVRQGYQSNENNLLKAKKLISKVKSKFARLPALISAKLRANSSPSRIFLDHATGSVEQPVETASQYA